jgi:hypothetical protein
VQEFLAALREEAVAWHDADPLNSQVYDRPGYFLVLGLDVCDRDRHQVLRTLRVDYGPRGIAYGEDETQQFATALSPSHAEYGEVSRPEASPSDLARLAARWLRAQMLRRIELLEWIDGDYWLRRYRLADTGRSLCWSAANNTPRSALGKPTRVSPVPTLAPRASGAPAA